MPSIHAFGVSFAYVDALPLFEDAAFVLPAGWTGLVGPNGAGKSTLLELLAGRRQPSAGTLHFDPERPVVHLCPQRVDAIDPAIEALAWDWEREAVRIRDRLALDPEALERWSTLSPGERKRWQVGAALLGRPDVLLLDEPTNHLDVQARERLVRALHAFRGVGVVVSHDRALLESLATRTLWLEGGSLVLLGGSYGEARAQRESERAQQLQALTRAQKEKRRQERRLAERRQQVREASAQRHAGRRMRHASDSDARTLAADFRAEKAERRLGRSTEVLRREAARAASAVAQVEMRKEVGRSVFLDWEPAPKATLLSLEADAIAVGGETILSDVHLVVGREDRVHVAGPNGAGKSTLLRALLEDAHLPQDRVLVLPQEIAPADRAALAEEVRSLPPEERGRLLSLVAALGLDPERLIGLDDLSPGETRKLLLASGMARQAWLLVLDEPTNHLDLPSIERLEAALAQWPGALLLVTHDEDLAARCTTARWDVGAGRVQLG